MFIAYNWYDHRYFHYYQYCHYDLIFKFHSLYIYITKCLYCSCNVCLLLKYDIDYGTLCTYNSLLEAILYE